MKFVLIALAWLTLSTSHAATPANPCPSGTSATPGCAAEAPKRKLRWPKKGPPKSAEVHSTSNQANSGTATR